MRSLAAGLSLALLAGGSAAAQVEPYGTGQTGTFRNILPPGENGFANLAALAQYEAGGSRPAHEDDQLAMYHGLTTAAPNIQAGQIPDFFKDATFGVRAGGAASSESPEPGVTIVRDSAYGVPHIYGDTRDELEFGIGWATAEDRLFAIDVLRHAGAGDLAGFAGGSNLSQDASSWANEPYTHDDLLAQVSYIATLPGGAQVIRDATSYVAGVNAYITMAEANPINQALYLPAEYAAIGRPQGPVPFAVTDIVATASLIGGQLGQGGGEQLRRAILLEDLDRRLGAERRPAPGWPGAGGPRRARARGADLSGFATLTSFTAPDDRDAPTTVAHRRFPYQTLPRPSARVAATVALPDPGSVRWQPTVVSRSGGAADPGALAAAARLDPAAARAEGLIDSARGGGLLAGFPHSESNALLVSARHSSNGRPIAVIGPQVAYWSPEILMEQDIHGGGIDAEGASFPGTNVYVELGHGTDYAWSATSEGQNIIDTFAVPLCQPGGGKASPDSDHYLLRGRCTPMEALSETESWTPNLADSTAAGSATLQTFRTAYGLVFARATIHGRPVAYTHLRSTYLHELDSATGFEAFNDPAQMRTPQQFQRAAFRIGYTFNWFFVNPRHIAYLASGANPVRAAHTDPIFPTWSAYPWQGYRPQAVLTPAGTTERQTPFAAHPQVIDQDFITSWNNKPAPGYDYVDGDYASVFRSQLLDRGIEHYLSGGRRMSLVDLINAMGNAGTQDLRGVEVLPYALRIIGNPGPAPLRATLRTLRAWVAGGAHRIDRATPSASGDYEQSQAVRVMDAWWPLMIGAVFQPALGPSLLAAVQANLNFNDAPHTHLGSAWDTGFYGTVQEDLRGVLAGRPLDSMNRLYCGTGSRRRCRAALAASLAAAAAEPASQVYPAGGGCGAGDQKCYDAIHYRAIGALTIPSQEWVNRPTFQQAIEFGAP